MDKYIGLDVHATSCTAAIVDARGKRLGHHVLETNGQVLVEFFKTLKGALHVCMEEGTQAGWLVEILSAHVERVVTLRVPESRGAFGLRPSPARPRMSDRRLPAFDGDQVNAISGKGEAIRDRANALAPCALRLERSLRARADQAALVCRRAVDNGAHELVRWRVAVAAAVRRTPR